MNRFLIRSTLQEDFTIAESLLRERGLSMAGSAPVDDPVVHSWVALMLSSTTRYQVAEDPPNVLGVASVLRSNTMGILFVFEEHRRIGVGIQLLRQVETWLHLRVGDCRITVPPTVAPWFEKQGYHVQSPMSWADRTTLLKSLPEPRGGPRDLWAQGRK